MLSLLGRQRLSMLGADLNLLILIVTCYGDENYHVVVCEENS